MIPKTILLPILILTIFATSSPALAQTPQSDPPSDQLQWLDSLTNDPDFQQETAEFAEGLLSMGAPTPQSILHTELPTFSLTNLQGEIVSNDQLLGQVTCLYIWSPDVDQTKLIKQLNKVKKEYTHQEVNFVGLFPGTPDQLRATLQQQPLRFDNLPASPDLTTTLSYIPQVLLVDRHGTIRYAARQIMDDAFEKPTDWQALRHQLNELLVE